MDDTLHSEVQIDGRVEEILKELKFVYDIGDGVVIDLNEKILDDKYDDLVGFIMQPIDNVSLEFKWLKKSGIGKKSGRFC